MLRKFFLPVLAVALLAAESAAAQTAPAAQAAPTAKDVRVAYRKAAKAERVLSKREQAAAAAAAKAEQARLDAQQAATAANTTWNGWSNEPLPAPAPAANGRAVGYNMQAAPGMPLNQIGHGVTTDYDGRPLRTASASTLPTARR